MYTMTVVECFFRIFSFKYEYDRQNYVRLMLLLEGGSGTDIEQHE